MTPGALRLLGPLAKGWDTGRGGNWIAPSVAVEFDTYQNHNQNDPPYDHVALLVNGINLHPDDWKEISNYPNLENNKLHAFRFRWNPADQSIRVHLDGRVIYQGKRDLINKVFKGKTKMIWGFTASTGRKHNLQYFCLKRLAAKPALRKPLEPTGAQSAMSSRSVLNRGAAQR